MSKEGKVRTVKARQASVNDSRDKLASIQIARAIAALSVLLFHSHFAVAAYEARVEIPFFTKHGSFGVDLFFVVSGFIIAHIAGGRSPDLKPYLIRRFFRIYPIYWMFLIFAVIMYFRYDYRLGGNEYSTATLIKSFLILPIKDQPWYAVGWTLEHEIIFYVVAGIVFSFAGYYTLMAVLLAAGVAGLALHSVLPSLGITHDFWDWHFLDPSMLLFFAGVAVCKYRNTLAGLGVGVPAIIFALTLWASAAAIDSGVAPIPQFGTVLVAAAAALIVTLLNFERIGGFKGSASRLLILIGDASFSLYLVHWAMVIELGRVKWRSLFGLQERAEEPWRAAVIILCIILAVLMFRFIETPIIFLGHKIAKLCSREPISVGSQLRSADESAIR